MAVGAPTGLTDSNLNSPLSTTIMEPAQEDSFIALLVKKQRNLKKRLLKIQSKTQKQGALDNAEQDMIKSQDKVQGLMDEIERMIEKYTLEAKPKKPPKKETNRALEVADLWLLGDFMSHSDIAKKFVSDPEQLQHFLDLHSAAKGEPGKTLADILSSMQHIVTGCLTKSDSMAPGTMCSFKNITEFSGHARNWCMGQERPATPQKPLLLIDNSMEQSDGNFPLLQQPEHSASPEEAKERGVSNWADEVDEWLDDSSAPQPRAAQTPEATDFIQVTKKRKKKDEGFERVENKRPARGARRGRGRGK